MGGERRRLRGALGWLPALVLVPAGFAVAVHAAQLSEPPAVTRELLPLDPGTTWVYSVSDHGQDSGTHTRQVLGGARLAGLEKNLVNSTRVEDTWTDFPAIGPRQTSSYFAPSGDQIRQYGLITPAHKFEQLVPAAKVYELVTDVGDSWSYKGQLDFQDLTFTTELTERGPVEVGGHTFEGCSHFVTTTPYEVKDQPTTTEVQEEWTCPGYGPVRSSDRYEPTDVDITQELVEFHGDRGDWWAAPPEDDGADEATSALGFDTARTNAVLDGHLGRDLAWTVGQDSTSDFPPVSGGDVMVTGDNGGLVSATNVTTGEPLWQVRLTPPILVTPVVVGDTVLVADGGKTLHALSLTDGSTRWRHVFDDVVTVSPAAAGDGVAVATDDGRLSVLELSDGSVRWDERMAGPATTAPAVSGGTVYVCDEGGNVSAYDLDDGEDHWSRSLADGALLGPAVANGRLLAQDDSGIIFAFDGDDGTLEWQTRTRGVGYGYLAADKDMVVSLVSDRYVVAADAADGHRLWRHRVPATRVAPVIVGDEVLTVSAKGLVELLALDSGAATDTWELPRPSGAQEPRVDVATAVVGDSVVVTSDPGTSPAFQTLYAYPLHGDGTGVLLGLHPHVVAASATEPVTTADGDIYVPGFDGTVTRNTPDGESTVLVTNEERSATGAAVADGLAVVRRDEELLAVPVEGGDPVWSVPAGKAYAGSIPLVSDGTVFAGTSDGRLLAVGLTDGSVRWSAPVDPNYLPSTPAALPDGDIVYGVGLGRYDAATGDPRWSLPGVVSYGAPAVADGTVFAAVDRAGDTSGFGAWDAATGRALWFVPGVPASYVGPGVADGTAVFVDTFGTVHALAAEDGTELWSAELHRPVGGVPVLRDGRVYLAGLGRPEDIDRRDYRVAAYDLATGRFLASWEPPILGFWNVPFVSPGGPGDPDALLVPTGGDFNDVVMGVRPVG